MDLRCRPLGPEKEIRVKGSREVDLLPQRPHKMSHSLASCRMNKQQEFLLCYMESNIKARQFLLRQDRRLLLLSILPNPDQTSFNYKFRNVLVVQFD